MQELRSTQEVDNARQVAELLARLVNAPADGKVTLNLIFFDGRLVDGYLHKPSRLKPTDLEQVRVSAVVARVTAPHG